MNGKRERYRRIVWLILEVLIAVGVLIVWLSMFSQRRGNGLFSSRGITSLRYYTVLSNLVACAGSACCVVSALRWRRGEKPEKKVSRGVCRFRFVGTVMAATTFLTVLLFFFPIFGWNRLYSGANFWFHLVFPIASAAGFFLMPGSRLTFRDTLLPILPVMVYAAFYSINILINGRGQWPRTNDWYGFLTWGWGVGWGIFAGIAAATWIAALLLYRMKKRFGGTRKNEERL